MMMIVANHAQNVLCASVRECSLTDCSVEAQAKAHEPTADGRGMSVRSRGLTWALVCSPMIGWAAAWYGQRFDRGLSVFGAFVLLAILPAVVASAGNALLGRHRGAVLRAGILGALVCYLGFLFMVLLFLLTVPDEFFTMNVSYLSK
jgi:hypothetical protein